MTPQSEARAVSAVVAAFVFALHPVQTEAIVYVFARSGLLATLFCLLALRSWLAEKPWVGTGWFALGLLAKEECAAFPVFLWFLEYIRKRERRIPALGAMAGLAGVAVWRVAVLAAETPGSGAGAQADVTPMQYLATQGWSIIRYLQLLAIPVGFSVEPNIRVIGGWLAVICWSAVSLLLWMGWQRKENLGPGFWFLGGLILLAPTSSIFPASDLAADRRVYLPMVAWSAMVGLILHRTNYRVLLVAGGILYAMFSFVRTQAWMSEVSLWEDAMRWAPEKVRPRVQLARASPPDRALDLLEEARRIEPENSRVATEMGRVYLTQGKPGEALREFGRVVAALPNDPSALNNRGVALLALGMKDHAVADFRKAVELQPCLGEAWDNLRKAGAVHGGPDGCDVDGLTERIELPDE